MNVNSWTPAAQTTAEELDEREGRLDLRDFRAADGVFNCYFAKAAAEPPNSEEALVCVAGLNLTDVG
jgi:hypothetical protein